MPQTENCFTQIANELIEQFARIRIPGEAMQVFWVMLRKIYGFHKKSDPIALSQIVAATGLSKVAVCKAIKKLIELNLITKKGNKIAAEYAINKHFDTWKPLPKKVTLPKKVMAVTQKGNLPLPKKYTTKETITKETITKERKKEYPAKNCDASVKTAKSVNNVEIPDKLNTPEFLAAWEEWQTYRKQKRQTLTAFTIKKQLEFLSSIGVQDAVISINESIKNGYTGLFKVKQATRNNDNNGFDAMEWLKNA
jgi:phage replication O-like protein O